MARKRESVISNDVLDELVQGIQTEEDLNAVMRQLSKGLLERVLEAEMTEHLGHENGGVVINPEGNTRTDTKSFSYFGYALLFFIYCLNDSLS